MNTKIAVALLGALFLSVGCTAGESASGLSDEELKEQVARVIKENPSIVLDVIKDNPVEFIDTLQGAVDEAREKYAQDMMLEQKAARDKLIEQAFANPLQPAIREDEAIRGNKDAPLVLVEYSDFECPYCSRGAAVVESLRDKYGDQLQFVYKHLPLLGMHKQAEIAARYYEALRLQDHEKAFAYHDALFADQGRLKREGEAFLIELAESTGADMQRLTVDVKSEEVGARIEADMKEADSFGFTGTPAYVLNGIPVFGAYPQDHFESIIERLQEQGRVTLNK
jgi:protein-disulfide isomerase